MNDFSNQSLMSPCSSDESSTKQKNRMKAQERSNQQNYTTGLFHLQSILALIHSVEQSISDILKQTENKTVCKMCQSYQQYYLQSLQEKLHSAYTELHAYLTSALSADEKNDSQSQQEKMKREESWREIETLKKMVRELEEQKEHLGAQLIAYKEDFDSERGDRERAQGIIEDLKIQLVQQKQLYQAEIKRLKQLQQRQQQSKASLNQARDRREETYDQAYVQVGMNAIATAPPPYNPDYRSVTAEYQGGARQGSNLMPGQNYLNDVEIDGHGADAGLIGRSIAIRGAKTVPIAAANAMCRPQAANNVNSSVASGRYVKTAAASETPATASTAIAAAVSCRTGAVMSRDHQLTATRCLYQTDSSSAAMPAEKSDYQLYRAEDDPVYEKCSIDDDLLYSHPKFDNLGVDEADGCSRNMAMNNASTVLESGKALTARDVFNMKVAGSSADKFESLSQPLNETPINRRHLANKKIDLPLCSDHITTRLEDDDELESSYELESDSGPSRKFLNLYSSFDIPLVDTAYNLCDDYCNDPDYNDRLSYDHHFDNDNDETPVIRLAERAAMGKDLLRCPKCDKAFTTEQHHLLINHMEEVCMQ